MWRIDPGTEVAVPNSQGVPISQVVLKTGFTVIIIYYNCHVLKERPCQRHTRYAFFVIKDHLPIFRTYVTRLTVALSGNTDYISCFNVVDFRSKYCELKWTVRLQRCRKLCQLSGIDCDASGCISGRVCEQNSTVTNKAINCIFWREPCDYGKK